MSEGYEWDPETPQEFLVYAETVEIAKKALDDGAEINGWIDGTYPTALHWAARGNNLPVIRFLLARGAKVALETPDGIEQVERGYSVHYAAENGLIELLEILLNADGKEVINEFDYVSRTPLMCAVQNGHLDAARLLIDSGADVNANEEERIGETALSETAEEGTIEMIQLLLEAGADPTIEGWMRLTPINRAEQRDDGLGPTILKMFRDHMNEPASQWVKNLLPDNQSESDALDLLRTELQQEDACTPTHRLLMLCMQDDLGVSVETLKEAESLLRAGADPNDCAVSGNHSALYFATLNERSALVRLLIGADATIARDHVSPISDDYRQREDTSLHAAARTNNHELVGYFLDESDGVEFLNHFNHQQHVPLFDAVQNNNLEMAATLLKAGAHVNAMAFPKVANTALKNAAEAGTVGMVQLLLEYGADPTIPGWMMRTSLCEASGRRDKDGPTILRLLKERLRASDAD